MGEGTRLVFLGASLPMVIETTPVHGQNSFDDFLAEVQPVIDSPNFDAGAWGLPRYAAVWSGGRNAGV